MARWWLCSGAIACMGCGRLGFDAASDAGSDADAGLPALVCSVPAAPDLSVPDLVVGDGTPASCTETALRTAVLGGGVITFDCGAASTTIAVTSELVIAAPDTVLAAGGLVTLDGGGLTRLIHATTSVQSLTLMGLELRNGATTGYGAGVYVEAGTLRVFDSNFEDNIGPAMSPNAGGGAIAAAPGVSVVIAGSRFDGNFSASGGALSVFSDLIVTDTLFTDNIATGTGGSSAMGGLGGAIASVGIADNSFCAVGLSQNRAGFAGAGYLRISTNGSGSDRWERSTLQDNLVPTGGGGGGMYVQNVALELDRVAIVGNRGGIGGGIWYIGSGPFVATNLLVADNVATSGLGAGLSIGDVPGEIRFSTIAGNHASCPACWAGAIDGSGVTLTATVIAGNRADAPGSPVSCRATLPDGGTNFQWPVLRSGGGSDDPTALCTAGVRLLDPKVGFRATAIGPAGTFPVIRPLADSAVIGAATGCPATDLLGLPRPTPCAAGALEP